MLQRQSGQSNGTDCHTPQKCTKWHSPYPLMGRLTIPFTLPAQLTHQMGDHKFSRLTHTTFYCFITGHAFTGEYIQHFFPQHTPEQIACQCGEPLQTVEHVVFRCPLFTAVCCRCLTVRGHPQSFLQLLENKGHIQTLLQFLEETRACNKLCSVAAARVFLTLLVK